MALIEVSTTSRPSVGNARTVAPHLLLAAAGFVALAGLVPLSVVSWQGTTAASENIALALILVCFSAGRLMWTVALRHTRFMTAICYVFFYVFVAIASLGQIVARRFPLDNRDYPASLITHQLIVLLCGCLAFEMGIQLAESWKTSKWCRAAKQKRQVSSGSAVDGWGFSPGRTIVVALLGIAFALYEVAVHGVAAFFVSRQQTTALLAGQDPSDNPFYQSTDKALGLLTTFLAQYLVFVSLLVILYSRRHGLWHDRGRHTRLGWTVLILALIAANVVMNNPVGNGRWWFCLVLVSLASVFVPVDRRANTVVYVAGALLVLLFAFTYLDAFRTSDRDASLDEAHGLASESYPVLQMGLNGDEYVDKNGHTQGRQLAGAIFTLVPRRVWPDKPIPTGQVVDPQFLRSASAWTELYVDFGVPGVIAFFCFYGFLIRVIEDKVEGIRSGAGHAVFPLAATYQLFLLRGSFMPAVGAAYQLMALVAFISSRSRRESVANKGAP